MDDLAVQQYVRLATGTLAAAVVVAIVFAIARRIRAGRKHVGRVDATGRVRRMLVAAITAMLGLSVALLLTTSLFALWQRAVLGGWFLFFHTAGGGTLIAVLPLAALLWLGVATQRSGSDDEVRLPWQPEGSFASVLLGAVLITGLITAGSMLLGMLPLFDTSDMRRMLSVHAYSGLALGVATIFWLFGKTKTW